MHNPLNLPRMISSDTGTEEIWYYSSVSKFKSRVELEDKTMVRYFINGFEFEAETESESESSGELGLKYYYFGDGRLKFEKSN